MRTRIRWLGPFILLTLAAGACSGDNGQSSSSTAPTITVSNIAVSGVAPTVGAAVQFTAMATLSSGATQDLTSQATWQSSNAAVAAVSSTGIVNGVAAGDAVVRATYQTFTGTKTITVSVPQSSCRFTLSATNLSVGAAGATTSLTVTPSADTCTWSASSNSAFIAVTGGASSIGVGTVGLSITANGGGSRSGTLTIAGQAVTVNQDAASLSGNCVSSISPTSQNFGENGPAPGSVSVTAPSNCSWTATPNSSFLTLTGGGTGTGNGSVSYSVANNSANTGRSGTISIGGQTFTVTQDARPCPVSVSPTHFDVDGVGCAFVGSSCLGPHFVVTVSMIGSCAWTLGSNDPSWLGSDSLISSGGSGSGAADIKVFQNNSGQTRTGSVTMAGQAVTVTQTACTFSLSPLTASVGSAATTIVFTAQSSPACLYNFNRNTNFLNVGFQSIGYTGINTISVGVPENTSASARTDTLQMYGRESSGGQTVILTATVTQSGKP